MDQNLRDESLDLETVETEAVQGAGEERIAHLERSVAQLRMALMAGGVVLGAGLAFTVFGGAPAALSVRELSVVDAEGKPRIALSAATGEATLELLDRSGKVRLAQTTDADGKAAWTLFDPQGERRIGAVAFGDGDAGFALLDPGGKVRIQMLSQSGTASTLHLDSQGRKRVETSSGPDGSAISRYMDASGAVTVALGTKPDGEGLLTMPKRDGTDSSDLAAADTDPDAEPTAD
jgi:hypothetical protein